MLSAKVIDVEKSNIASTFTDALGHPTGFMLKNWIPEAKTTSRGELFLPIWDVSGESTELLEVNLSDTRDDIKRLWNYDEAPDPIGIHGVGWMERQIGALDRIIVEGCYLGYKVSEARIDFSDNTPMHFRPENIQRRIGAHCSLADANTLVSAWKSLELTPAIITQSINKMRRMENIGLAVVKTVELAQELDSVTVHPDQFIPDESEFLYCVDDEPETFLARTHNAEGDWSDYAEYVNDYPEYQAGPAESFSYIPLGITEYDFGNDWFDSQPKWFKSLIYLVQSTTSCDALGQIKKARYEKCGDHAQSSYFWWMCKIQQRKLERPGRANLKTLLKWLKRTTKPQGFLKKYLFDLKLNPKMKCLSNRQWTCAWNLLKAKGLARTGKPTAPVPPLPADESPQLTHHPVMAWDAEDISQADWNCSCNS